MWMLWKPLIVCEYATEMYWLGLKIITRLVQPMETLKLHLRKSYQMKMLCELRSVWEYVNEMYWCYSRHHQAHKITHGHTDAASTKVLAYMRMLCKPLSVWEYVNEMYWWALKSINRVMNPPQGNTNTEYESLPQWGCCVTPELFGNMLMRTIGGGSAACMDIRWRRWDLAVGGGRGGDGGMRRKKGKDSRKNGREKKGDGQNQ